MNEEINWSFEEIADPYEEECAAICDYFEYIRIDLMDVIDECKNNQPYISTLNTSQIFCNLYDLLEKRKGQQNISFETSSKIFWEDLPYLKQMVKKLNSVLYNYKNKYIGQQIDLNDVFFILNL